MIKNIFKPRYKIAFLAKNKIWYYKDSRLRRFFNIRGKKLVRRGLFKRYFLVFNNMKWTIARRAIRPFMHRRAAVKRRYKTSFYIKQQVRHFYGKIKEKAFRKFFRNHITSISLRNNSFYSALERRTDMFLFRTRLLPTIYAANQFVHHQGIEINGIVEKSPNALVRPGTLLSFNSKYWTTFSDLLCDRIYFRLYGIKLWEKRAYTRLKKKVRWLSKINRYRRKNEILVLKKLLTLRKRVQPILERFSANYFKLVKNWELIFYQYYKSKIFSIDELKHFMISTKYFRLKLSEISKQIKQLRLTVQYNRKASIYGLTSHFKSGTLKNKKLQHILQSFGDVKKQDFVTNNTFLNRYKVLYNKHYNVKEFDSKQYNYRWRNSNTKFLKFVSLLNTFYTSISDLFTVAGLWEFDMKVFVLNHAKKMLLQKSNNVVKQDYLLLLQQTLTYASKNRNYLVEKSALLKDKIRYMFEAFIKRKIRYKRWMVTKTGSQKLLRKNPLYYFLMYRKVKKMRKLAIPRLKSVHWYIPTYIHFDFKTMQAVFLHHPLPEEIYYPFKCSLPKLTSFYRSRGY